VQPVPKHIRPTLKTLEATAQIKQRRRFRHSYDFTAKPGSRFGQSSYGTPMTDHTNYGMDSFQGNSVLYDRHAMFKGALDVRVKKMMKLGKNNIKYLASGPDLIDGCKGLLGRFSTLDDEARSHAMKAANNRSELHSPSNGDLNR
jgi:hypothetical protein